LFDQVKGALSFIVLVVVILGGWKAVTEYRYYQILKKEHQAFFMEELGRTGDGKPFTRKMFFDAIVAESVKAQQARKE